MEAPNLISEVPSHSVEEENLVEEACKPSVGSDQPTDEASANCPVEPEETADETSNLAGETGISEETGAEIQPNITLESAREEVTEEEVIASPVALEQEAVGESVAMEGTTVEEAISPEAIAPSVVESAPPAREEGTAEGVNGSPAEAHVQAESPAVVTETVGAECATTTAESTADMPRKPRAPKAQKSRSRSAPKKSGFGEKAQVQEPVGAEEQIAFQILEKGRRA